MDYPNFVGWVLGSDFAERKIGERYFVRIWKYIIGNGIVYRAVLRGAVEKLLDTATRMEQIA
jgi:hypothetical protein